MEEESSEIFEITDFTTATEFERFVSRLEEVIHEWKLTQDAFDFSQLKDFDINSAKWSEDTDEISYIDYPFTVTHYYLKPPSSTTQQNDAIQHKQSGGDNSTNLNRKESWTSTLRSLHTNKYDFPAKAHCLCRWYGLTDFVVISPKSFSLTSQDKINSIQSAMRVAAINSGCAIPLFLQALDDWRKFYIGCCLSPSIETNFEMVHLYHIPEKFQHLSGLLEVFKGKLNITSESPSKAIVSVRFTYILQDWEEYMFDWPQSSPDLGADLESPAIGFTSIEKLPFGACQDPVSELYLFATWLNMCEDVVTESSVYSDLDPIQAPLWTVRVTLSPHVQCLLGDCLSKFAELCSSHFTFEQVLGRRLLDDEDNESTAQISNALERLTSPQTNYNIPSLSRVTNRVVTATSRLRMKTRNPESPIPIDILNKILYHVFPDAKEDVVSGEEEDGDVDDEVTKHKELFKFYKTAPIDSPLYKLAVCCCLVNYAFGGLKAVAHLWHEFVLEMRYRLENSILIPGLEKGNPNLALGIMYQKLQMLNCCIEKKMQRDKETTENQKSVPSKSNSAKAETVDGNTVNDEFANKTNRSTEIDNEETSATTQTTKEQKMETESQSSSSDDEFFECDSDRKEVKLSTATTVESIYEDSIQYQPQGRAYPLDNLRLLSSPNELLYVPLTQEPAPMTEDLLAEHADVLTKLGTSAEGASLRAKMQSASLVSDMESFKAANPGCVLEDFVRWYSPRDYIIEAVIDSETGQTVDKGALSERMLVPGNMWQEVWESSKPIPAHRQKRLFDDTKEAEKVLHFLSSLSPAQVVLHLLPLVCQSALLALKSQDESLVIPTVTQLMDSVTSSLEKKTRSASQTAGLYTDTVNQFKTAELVIARARSLHLKFACEGVNKSNDDIRKFVLDLMQQEELKVIGAARGPVGKSIYKMFADAKEMTKPGIEAEDSQPPPSTSETEENQTEQIFPAPSAKEYILRAVDPRPAPYSQSLPQRMYCTLVDDTEYRLAGAFSNDLVFH